MRNQVIILSSLVLLLSLLQDAMADKTLRDSRISRIVMAPVEAAPAIITAPKRELTHSQSAIQNVPQPEVVTKELNVKKNKKKFVSNEEVMSKLGLAKIVTPSNHHRKRLAVQSRRHARPDDSHMYVIKLPPNNYYYSLNKAGASASSQNAITDQTASQKVSLGFQSNGKPGHIYHWNLPQLQKAYHHHQHQKHQPYPHAYRSNLENETTNDKSKFYTKKTKKSSASTYYMPAGMTADAQNVRKYFPGNGKPQSFYVIKTSKGASRSRHHQQHHQLIH